MTVYKYFLKTALKHKWMIIGYTLIFLVLSIINGASTDTKNIAFMETNFDIGVVDKSNSNLSKSLIGYLEEKNNLVVMKDNIKNIKERIFLEEIDAAVIIPEDFIKKVENKEEAIEIIRDDRKMESIQVENLINKFIVFADATYKDGRFDLYRVRASLSKEIKVEILSSDNNFNNGANTWFKYYFNFTGYIIIAIYVAVIGLIMTDFNNESIKARTSISSKQFLKFNTEMYLGQVTIGIVITTIFILGSILLKGKYIGQVNFPKFLLNTGIFSFAILCLTFLVNNLTTSKFIINGISTVASLGTAFISGVLVPQEFLGERVLAIAKFFPTYYFVKINETEINSFSDVRYEIFMQVLFGISFLLLGLYFSKVKRKA